MYSLFCLNLMPVMFKCSWEGNRLPHTHTDWKKQWEDTTSPYIPHLSWLPSHPSRCQHRFQPLIKKAVSRPEAAFTGNSTITSSRAHGPRLNAVASGKLLRLDQNIRLRFSRDRTRSYRRNLDCFTTFRSHEVQSKIHQTDRKMGFRAVSHWETLYGEADIDSFARKKGKY